MARTSESGSPARRNPSLDLLIAYLLETREQALRDRPRNVGSRPSLSRPKARCRMTQLTELRSLARRGRTTYKGSMVLKYSSQVAKARTAGWIVQRKEMHADAE